MFLRLSLYLCSISHTSNTMRLCRSDFYNVFQLILILVSPYVKMGKGGLRLKSQHLLILNTDFWKLYFSWKKLQELHQIFNLENIQNIFTVVDFLQKQLFNQDNHCFFLITTVFKNSWRTHFYALLARMKSCLIFFLKFLTLLLKVTYIHIFPLPIISYSLS